MMKEKINAFEKRIHEIDFFRGILILFVIFDHLMWFFNYYIFDHQSDFLNWYWTAPIRLIIRQIILMLFLFTCGISCYLSRNNKKRGLLLFGLTLLIPLATHLLQLIPIFGSRVIAVDFNILGVIAISVLVYACFEKGNNKDIILLTVMLALMYLLIVFARYVNPVTKYDGIKSVFYLNFNPIKEGYVADYLPLFPYIIFLPLGVLFARIAYPNKVSLLTKKNWEKPVCFLGRHTLFIYIAHEVVFTLVFMGIGAIIHGS